MAQLAITSSTWIQRGIFLMESKRWIHIVSFLNFIQEKSQGRHGKPMEKQIAIFDGVKPEASLKCFIANPIKH
jgi:hypothetical protein